MIENLVDYFEPEQTFYLDNIFYQKNHKKDEAAASDLNFTDTIETKIIDDTVEVVVKRNIKFDPEALFELTISYGVTLTFNKNKYEEYDWNNLDLAREFQENGEFCLDNLLNRMSLLIAQITSAAGQSPLVMPPVIAGKMNEKS